MGYDRNNVFARILRGELPCQKVYEDAHVLAFRDIQPRAPTHVIVIPKGEYVSLDDFAEAAMIHGKLRVRAGAPPPTVCADTVMARLPGVYSRTLTTRKRW